MSPNEVSEFVDRLKFIGLLEEIDNHVRRKYGVHVRELILRDQHKHVADARSWAMYLVRTRLGWSYPAIGHLFKRDQSTIQHACRKAEKMSKEENEKLNAV